MSEVARDYHQRSKHALNRYAAGPETLDWDAQPDPWRRYAGAPVQPLPLVADTLSPSFAELHRPGAVPPQPLTRRTVAALLELSLGLSAWKSLGPDRWALRCNPSSGNLHPTEAYVRCQGVDGLADGLWHYAPREHALERRAHAAGSKGRVGLWIGLSSIHWREAWKYGERAFRYSQLDIGHAVGALRYAAAVLGWTLQEVAGLDAAALARHLGLDRDADFGPAEREDAELLLGLQPQPPAMDLERWAGQANRLDRRPMYRWPVIDDVARATRPQALQAAATDQVEAPTPTPPGAEASPRAATLIRQRRSAQRFDRRAVMPRSALQTLLQALQPAAGLPWHAGDGPPQVHPVCFVHRVEGLAPGAYVWPRSDAGLVLLQQTLGPGLSWTPVPGLAPLHRLVENPALAGTLRTLNCHQALGSDACLAVALLGAFDAPLAARADAYRRLLREAGLVGQVLYLQAEAQGLRGTGIGCYFDDAVHELLGLQGTALQSLYHFTVGLPLDDARLLAELPYAHLDESQREAA